MIGRSGGRAERGGAGHRYIVLRGRNRAHRNPPP